MIDSNPEELHRLEHRFQSIQTRLAAKRLERKAIEQEEGKLQCELTKLENQRYSMLKGYSV